MALVEDSPPTSGPPGFSDLRARLKEDHQKQESLGDAEKRFLSALRRREAVGKLVEGRSPQDPRRDPSVAMSEVHVVKHRRRLKRRAMAASRSQSVKCGPGPGVDRFPELRELVECFDEAIVPVPRPRDPRLLRHPFKQGMKRSRGEVFSVSHGPLP